MLLKFSPFVNSTENDARARMGLHEPTMLQQSQFAKHSALQDYIVRVGFTNWLSLFCRFVMSESRHIATFRSQDVLNMLRIWESIAFPALKFHMKVHFNKYVIIM